MTVLSREAFFWYWWGAASCFSIMTYSVPAHSLRLKVVGSFP